MDMLTDEMYEVKKRADGRWIVVYGKDMPQAGKPEEGEEAAPAVKADGKTIIALILNSKDASGHH